MTATHKDPILVVVQLTGANDYMNTIVPYSNPIYYDNRTTVGIPAEQVLPIDDSFGFSPVMEPLKPLYDQGNMAVINGIGYPNPNRSHFRSMDIWHTAEPEKIAIEGWLGKVVRDLDPQAENVLTAVNYGRGLPRALVLPGVPVASVGALEGYGVMAGIADQQRRIEALEVFARMYAPAIGTGPTMDYLGQTGLDALKGADILRTAPEKYQSTIEYADTPISRNLKGIAQVLLADLGTRIFYTQQAGYDTHSNQVPVQPVLLGDLSRGIADFYADIQEHDASDNVLVFVFTEFGRRVLDNGSGTDHGSGGMAMVFGDRIKGGMHGEYPSLKPEDLLEGDLRFNVDFRGVYATLIEQWLGLDPVPIVGGNYEQLALV
jgi:uncharacterized protein (DUF1501 family)